RLDGSGPRQDQGLANAATKFLENSIRCAPTITGLFHFSGGRTYGGVLIRLRVDADQRYPADPATAVGHYVATRPQVCLDVFRQGFRHREAAEFGSVLAEGADEMFGGEARRFKRLHGTHAEIHVVEDDLNGSLILLVSAGYRYPEYGLAVVEDHRGTQSDAWPLARLNHVGSSGKGVQAAEAAAVNDAGASGHAGCT